MLKHLAKWYKAVLRGSGVLSGICILLMVFTIVPDTIGRKFFGKPLYGTLELNQMLMVIVIFLGLAWTQSQRGHVRVEVITSRLKERNIKIANLIIWTLSLVLFFAITVGGICEAYNSTLMRETVWGIARFPVWPGKIILAFGCLLMCIQFVIDIFDELNYLLSKDNKKG